MSLYLENVIEAWRSPYAIVDEFDEVLHKLKFHLEKPSFDGLEDHVHGYDALGCTWRNDDGQEALKLIEEKEYEGHCKCMQNLHGLIALVMPFPTVGGTSRGSLRLKRYEFLKLTMYF